MSCINVLSLIRVGMFPHRPLKKLRSRYLDEGAGVLKKVVVVITKMDTYSPNGPLPWLFVHSLATPESFCRSPSNYFAQHAWRVQLYPLPPTHTHTSKIVLRTVELFGRKIEAICVTDFSHSFCVACFLNVSQSQPFGAFRGIIVAQPSKRAKLKNAVSLTFDFWITITVSSVCCRTIISRTTKISILTYVTFHI